MTDSSMQTREPLREGRATDPAETRPSTASYRPPVEVSPPGYEILGELGRGGMGVVYKARETTQLGRVVAIKMILPDRATEAEELARFEREAKAVAALKHPHFVTIFSGGQHNGSPYFVLEYVERGSLEQCLGEVLQPPRDAARLVMLLARAMHAAHQKGLIHRDLKPANVLLGLPEAVPDLNSAYGCPKITDLGLVKRLEGDQTTITQSGAVLGTPSYMAPEQAAGRNYEVGPATDVHALGAILYRCLTGRPPFKGSAVLNTLELVKTQLPEPPSRLAPGTPAALETICLRCLAKSPADRYATADELAEDLRRFLDDQPLQPVARPSKRWTPRRLAAVGAALLVVIAGISAWAFLASGTPARTEQTPHGGQEPGRGAAKPVRGDIDVTIFDPTNQRRQHVRLTDAGTLPIKAGDEFSIEVKLDRPLYAYLLWIDTEGAVHPVYPWVGDDWKERPAEERKVAHLRRPEAPDEFYPMGKGKAGMDTLVLLARETPLPRGVHLAAELGGLPEQDEKNMRATVWFENGEIVRNDLQRKPTFTPRTVNDPVLAAQRRVLELQKKYFDYSRAVSFANQGK